MSITNRRGRHRLLQTPVCLGLNEHTLTPVPTIRVLGVELDVSGSANAWVRSARRKSANTLHLIRRISQKTGGGCSRMARILVRSIIEPRLIYQAQIQRLTLRDWDLLETADRDSMRAITCLPLITPIATPQAEAQLNTIDKIVHQRRVTGYLKSQPVLAAAALVHYYNSSANWERGGKHRHKAERRHTARALVLCASSLLCVCVYPHAPSSLNHRDLPTSPPFHPIAMLTTIIQRCHSLTHLWQKFHHGSRHRPATTDPQVAQEGVVSIPPTN
ncbi:hypothetical protein HPB51_009545 [Rhipicephalus microplus]|uniref:Uncharacterized protein n=1 Tax=Rhipicephalus microplus TaxID=6941 RepID=A0A9J6F0Y6_RHIMP|nr:hypothetical protein HPB51_009545 [Rhipicephalus microplus]